MKYIDAEKLIAEIKRRIENWTIRGEHSPAGQGRDTCESRVTELSDLLSFATSLQQEQPDVDLEKEISTWIPAHIRGGDNEEWKDTKNAVTEWGGIVARHFYELGKNSRKV